jgi:hypothetical protein
MNLTGVSLILVALLLACCPIPALPLSLVSLTVEEMLQKSEFAGVVHIEESRNEEVGGSFVRKFILPPLLKRSKGKRLDNFDSGESPEWRLIEIILSSCKM